MIYSNNREITINDFAEIMHNRVSWTYDGARLLYRFLVNSNENIELDPVELNNRYREISTEAAIFALCRAGYELEILDLIANFYYLEELGVHLDLTTSSEYENFKDVLTDYLGPDGDHTRVLLTNNLLHVLCGENKLSPLAATLDPDLFSPLFYDTDNIHDEVTELIDREFGVLQAAIDRFITYK